MSETEPHRAHPAPKYWHPCFDAIPEMVVLIDSHFNVLRANKAAEGILGLAGHKLVGKRCYQLLHGAEAPPRCCPLIHAAPGSGPGTVVMKEPHIGHTVKISIFPERDDRGKAACVLELLRDVTIQMEEERDAVLMTEALARSFSGITEAISELAERRDPYTAGHSRGVARWAAGIGREMGMTENDIRGIEVCATLHDIGKTTISSGILNKSGPLSDNEWGIVRTHPRTAYEVLCRIDFPWPVAEVVYQHQERLDGSGYPRGLRGGEIHPWARILAVADVIDAMMTHRPYRPAMPKRDVVNELKRGRGERYDAEVVDIAVRLLTKMDRRVLVVDDEPGVLNLFVRFLQVMDAGLDVKGFTEPEKALDAFEKQPFPVVVTDLSMPGMNGLELLKRLREIHPATRVVIVTGLGEKEHTVEALRLGASDFLEKPVGMAALSASVETMLSRYGEE